MAVITTLGIAVFKAGKNGGKLEKLGDLRIVTVSTSTSYMDQIRLHDRVRVTTTCEKIGNKSLTLFQRLLAGDRVCSESRSVMVAFDFSRQQSMPVPDAWRERLLAD